MTLLVCSSCRTSLSSDTPHCPKCGPQSLTFIISEDAAPAAAAADGDLSRRLVKALGRQFEVRRLVGRGGFAEVFEVEDTELQRRLAVKVLRPDIAWTSGMLARFKQEARAIARLSHPNTVPIHFVGEGEGLVFYGMPFIEGAPLSDVMRAEGPLDPARALAIAVPILEALDHAHAHGLVHRDVKPDNIVIEAGSGRALLVDFGISKSLGGVGAEPSHTQTGYVVGTPLYMSPEQALGQRNVDARADIYGMGAVLFQMLTGSPPFEGVTSQEIVSKHLTEPVRFPEATSARIPRWLSEVIVRAMAKQPADRFPTASAMLDELREGRPAGSESVVTAARVVSQLGREEPTVPMLQAEHVALVPVELHTAPPRAASPVSYLRRRRRLVVLAAVVLLIAGAAWVSRTAPVLGVANGLLVPIELRTGTQPPRIVPPGDSVRIRLPRGAALTAEWRVVRPQSATGREMGELLAGRIEDPEPRGVIRRRIDLSTIGGGYFAPIVTNGTSQPLQVTMFDGLGEAVECECEVAPGATDASLGYHRLSGAGGLRFTDSAGRVAVFEAFAAQVERGSGLYELAVGKSDFRVQPKPRVRPRRAEPATLAASARDTLGATSTESAGASAPPPAPAAAPAVPVAKGRADPLGTIFPNR